MSSLGRKHIHRESRRPRPEPYMVPAWLVWTLIAAFIVGAWSVVFLGVAAVIDVIATVPRLVMFLADAVVGAR